MRKFDYARPFDYARRANDYESDLANRLEADRKRVEVLWKNKSISKRLIRGLFEPGYLLRVAVLSPLGTYDKNFMPKRGMVAIQMAGEIAKTAFYGRLIGNTLEYLTR